MAHIDCIFRGGDIVTMDANNPVVEAVSVRNGCIEQAGPMSVVQSSMGPETRVFELGGRCMVPGFYDSHTHFVQTGLGKLGVDFGRTSSHEQMLEQIREKTRTLQPKELLLGAGLDELKLREKRYPPLEELDKVTPDRPVWINRVDSHSCMVNSVFLTLLDMDAISGGVDRDSGGQVTGVLRQDANFKAKKVATDMIPAEKRKEALKIAADAAVRRGVTTINAMEGGELFNDKDAEALLKYQDSVAIDLVLFWQTTRVETVLEHGLKRLGGCIALDGSFGSRTAALLEPYSDDPSTRGVLYFSDQKLENLVASAHKEGLQITFHAIGDRAIEQVITVYEKVQKHHPREGARHRIEHFELPTPDHIERAARLGLICSVQPAFEYFWGGSGMYGIRMGEERARRTNPFRSILDAGVILLGGSDSDVTPIDPLIGIQGAVTHSTPEHRITAQEALEMFTINGAYGVFQEDIKGSISPGKWADLVVLSENPLKVSKETIKDIQIHTTIKQGRTIYSSKD